MADSTAGVLPWFEWGAAHAPLPGQSECGDLYVARAFPGGALVAAIDGLGHGSEAAVAARSPGDEPALLIRQCHEELRRTRGVAITLASFRAVTARLTWLGVGNVEGVLFRMEGDMWPVDESAPLRGGVVGFQLPPLRAGRTPLGRGDVLVLVTDGIRSDFASDLDLGGPPQRVAERILARHARGTDDALAVVARFVGVEG